MIEQLRYGRHLPSRWIEPLGLAHLFSEALIANVSGDGGESK
jgi:hypothetical protein